MASAARPLDPGEVALDLEQLEELVVAKEGRYALDVRYDADGLNRCMVWRSPVMPGTRHDGAQSLCAIIREPDGSDRLNLLPLLKMDPHLQARAVLRQGGFARGASPGGLRPP